MWRYLAGGAAALLMVAVGVLVFNARARTDAVLPPQPLAGAAGQAGQATPAGTPLPDTVPEATQQTREQKRFNRYDKDRDGKVTRDEYLLARHKAFAKLDANHDGMLSFDEWAIKSETKFATADKDRSGALTAAEFATTAVKRKPKRRLNCPPAEAPSRQGEEEG
jgi:hypothetical protein